MCSSLFLFLVFFFRFAQCHFLFGQQFFDLLPLFRIGDGFEYFPIVLNILSVDKAPIGTFCLNLHIGGRGTTSSVRPSPLRISAIGP